MQVRDITQLLVRAAAAAAAVAAVAAAAAAAAVRIGFGAATRTPVLVDRTKSEVAGTLLTAQLALQHGLACNTAGGA